MARDFDDTTRALLRSGSINARTLVTVWLDSGTYRFVDDVRDFTSGGNTYIGASALFQASDIVSSNPLAAESVVITVDGLQLSAAGVEDPAAVLRAIMDEDYHQRRFDISIGIGAITAPDLPVNIPVYAGKINNCKLVTPSNSIGKDGVVTPEHPVLQITLDSLASRYKRASFRTRTHLDQLEIDPTDTFYQYCNNIRNNEVHLYWGGPDATQPLATTRYLGGGSFVGKLINQLPL